MNAPQRKPLRRRLASADRFEAQARSAERENPMRIDPVPAAPRLPGLGEGRPLPRGLRAGAEAAMRADLGAVRLHAGPLARPHLEAAGVAAMTAGPDVLVSSEAALTGPHGQALLLHELTHVLQQTGVRGPDGRLHATRHHGSGRPYADGGPLEGHAAPDRADLVTLLIVRHAAPAPADTHLVALVARLDGLTDLEGIPGSTLAAEVAAGRVVGLPVDVPDMSAPSRGLLFDLMKFGGFYPQARDLLVADPELMSVARHAPFLEFLETDPAAQSAILEVGLATGTEPNRLLRRRLPAAMFNYLMGIGRRYQGIYDLDAYWDPLEDETRDWDRLGRNDGHYLAGKLVVDLERTLGRFMGQVEARFSWILDPRHGMHFAALRLRQRLALAAAGWASDFAAQLAPGLGVDPLIEGLEQVAERATAAQAFWAQVIARLNAMAEAGIDEVDRLPESPLVERVRSRIERDGLLLLETPGRDYLSRAAYRDRRLRLSRSLRELSSVLSGITRAAWTEADAEAGPELGSEREVAGILEGLLEEITDTLNAYADQTSGASDLQIIDLQRAQRVGTARILGWVGAVLGSTRLQDRAAEIREGRDVDRHSLFLISDWSEDRSAPLSDLRDEIAASGSEAHLPISFLTGTGDEARRIHLPITVEDLISVYGLFYTRRLADALDAALETPVSDTPRGPGQRTILQEAYASARGDDRPTRWKVDEYIYIPNEDDPRSYREVLTAHHQTQAQLRAENPDAGAILFPNAYQGATFAWVIPPLAPLIQILRRVEIFNRLVGDWIDGDPAALTDLQWIAELSRVADASEADMDTILGGVAVTIGDLMGVEAERLAALYPRVMSHERRRLAVELHALLAAYAEDDLMNYGSPNDAERMIRQYFGMVRPDVLSTEAGVQFAHPQAQIAILFLNLSETLEAAFNPDLVMGYGRRSETRFDIITGFIPYLRMTLEASTPARRDQLGMLMTPEEVAALDYAAARTRLQQILTGFEEAAREMSERLALIGTPSGLRSNLFATTIEVSSEPFHYNGGQVRLLRMFRPFVFVPAYGHGEREVSEARLLDENREPLETTGALFRMQFGDAAPFDVTGEMTAENIRVLMIVRDIIADRAFVQSMENLQVVIETAGELMLDAAEFIPVAGQAIMVGRIIYEVTQFLTSDEFDSMISVIRGDPVAMLMEMLERLRDAFFDPDVIWEFLLFEASVLSFLGDGDTDEGRRRRRPRSGAGRFARIAVKIGEIPITLLRRLSDVNERMHPRVVSIQSLVSGNPSVARAMLFAALVLRDAESYAAEVAGMADLLSEGDPEAALEARLNAMIDTLSQIELPTEPIPNDMIIAAMIEFIMHRLERMGKFGKAIRVSNTVLEALGAYDQIASLIARAMAGSAVDPNQMWQEQFLPELTGAFDAAKTGFVASAQDVLGRFGMTPLEPPAETQITGRSMLEVSPSLDPAARPAAAPPGPIGAGRPLPPFVARRAALDFGHDFSHVRLHQGSDAARLTDRHGARALTSGSHVFLRPGLSPETGEGRRVFRHELGHVLQHTGPSPVGLPPNAPRLGKPQGGLRLNRTEEARAERTAERAAAPGHRLGAPLDAGRAQADGMSPMLGTGVFARILERFTEPADIDEFLEDLGRNRIRRSPGQTQAIRVWTDFAAALRSSTMRTLRGNAAASGVFDLLKDHAEARISQENTNRRMRIFGLARMAQKPLRNPPTGTNADTTELDLRVYVNLLEAFIYADMGLSVSIGLEASGNPRGIARVTFSGIDPGRIEGITHPLWVKLFDSTDTYLRTPRTGTPPAPLDATNKRLIYQIARLRRPNERVVPSRGFRADLGFLRRVQMLRDQVPTVGLMPWAQYVRVQASQPGFANGSGGDTEHKLRLGTHQQLTGAFNTPNRDSHHIPQYLFVEYFQNKATTPLFSRTGGQPDKLPGFAAGNEPGSITIGARSVDYGSLDPGSSRGGGVPAISLATRTHKTGRLHVGGSSDWPEGHDRGRVAQGQSGQVHTHFRVYAMRRLRALGAPTGGNDIVNDFRAVADWANAAASTPGGRGPGASAVEGAVFDAMRDTYRWMYFSVMRPALDRALRTEEPKFYVTAMVEQRGTGPLPSTHDPATNMGAISSVMRQVDAMQDTGALAEFSQ